MLYHRAGLFLVGRHQDLIFISDLKDQQGAFWYTCDPFLSHIRLPSFLFCSPVPRCPPSVWPTRSHVSIGSVRRNKNLCPPGATECYLGKLARSLGWSKLCGTSILPNLRGLCEITSGGSLSPDHLWPAVFTSICPSVSAQRRKCKVLRFCHFPLEGYKNKNILSGICPKNAGLLWGFQRAVDNILFPFLVRICISWIP